MYQNGLFSSQNLIAFVSNKYDIILDILYLLLEDNIIKWWENGKDAAKELGFGYKAINNCLREKRKTSNGFKWFYVKNYPFKDKEKDFLNSEVVTLSPLMADPIILEVKFDNFLPEIIRGAVQLGNRRSMAFSKYAVCRMYG